MMLLLRPYVLQYRVELARTNRKGCISPLPEKPAKTTLNVLDPLRRRFLYLFDHLGLRKSSRERGNDVNVIGNAVHAYVFATQVATYRREIRMHTRADRGDEPWFTVFRAKDNVEDDLTEGLGHRKRDSLTPRLQRFYFCLSFRPGALPQAADEAAPLAR